ncbi:MAG TPA: NAD-dependent epimerase/dehydratase family protein [Gemmatimonadales bacterium]|nr:NAD-dependent epimerase/dehydratase family protein [Gemmatimonadales bacterium]
MRVLVTGAAGFIGSHLVDALLSRGAEVVGLDNSDPAYEREAKEANLAAARRQPGFRLVEGSILDVPLVAGLLTPDTILVHLAARAGVRPSLADPVGYAETNVTGTAAVAEAARKAGVVRLVFASSSSVYGNDSARPFREDAAAVAPVSPYAATKRAGELLLSALAASAGLRVAALRYFTVIGPRQRPDLAVHAFTRRLVRGEPITLFGTGNEARDYTHCSDIVAGTLAALDWTESAPVGMEVFNLGGSRPIPLHRMVDVLAAQLGVELRIVRAPLPPGDVEFTAADLSRAGRVLGYRPSVQFEAGVADFVRWYGETHGHQR